MKALASEVYGRMEMHPIIGPAVDTWALSGQNLQESSRQGSNS